MKPFAVRNPIAAGLLVIATYILGLCFAYTVLFASLVLEGIKSWAL